MSTPLLLGEQLVGVLTAYSSKDAPFGEADKYALEHVASLLTGTVIMAPRATVVSFARKRA
jgi:putative methionine-R-sulfoxide reductase with GAF domain